MQPAYCSSPKDLTMMGLSRVPMFCQGGPVLVSECLGVFGSLECECQECSHDIKSR